MIRLATIDDVPALVAMGERMRGDTEYRTRVKQNPAQMAATATMLIQSPDGVVFVADKGSCIVGMFGAMAYPNPIDGQRVAGELFWWVNRESRGSLGVRLLRSGERWAAGAGAIRLEMFAPNERVAELYRRIGYEAAETTFIKELVAA